MDNNTFGKQLRRTRRKAFLSQRALAEKAKTGHSYIAKIELGDVSPPGEELLERIADVLNAPELIYAAGKMPYRLRALAKENPCLAELLTILSRQALPNEIYQYMIMLAAQHYKKERTERVHMDRERVTSSYAKITIDMLNDNALTVDEIEKLAQKHSQSSDPHEQQIAASLNEVLAALKKENEQ